MTKSTDVNFDDILAAELESDEDFRREWQRLTVARAFAAMLIRYRSDHKLSQTALAKVLGLSQPRVAQLESGERNPDVETIIKTVEILETEFLMDVGPATRESKMLTKRARVAKTAVTHGNVSVTAISA